MLKKLKGYAPEGAAMAQARNYSLRYGTCARKQTVPSALMPTTATMFV